MASERPVLGWLCAGLFALGIPASLIMLFTNSVYLKLDREGFEMGSPLKKSRTSWRDVESFELAAIGGAKMIAIHYREGYDQQRIARTIAAAAGGIQGAVANNYSASLPELLQTLREWHSRYGGGGD